MQLAAYALTAEDQIDTLLTLLLGAQGIVTHVTDVKPLVSVVAYTDPETGYEVYQEVTGRTFKPLDNDSKEVGCWAGWGEGGGGAVRLGLCGWVRVRKEVECWVGSGNCRAAK